MNRPQRSALIAPTPAGARPAATLKSSCGKSRTIRFGLASENSRYSTGADKSRTTLVVKPCWSTLMSVTARRAGAASALPARSRRSSRKLRRTNGILCSIRGLAPIYQTGDSRPPSSSASRLGQERARVRTFTLSAATAVVMLRLSGFVLPTAPTSGRARVQRPRRPAASADGDGCAEPGEALRWGRLRTGSADLIWRRAFGPVRRMVPVLASRQVRPAPFDRST